MTIVALTLGLIMGLELPCQVHGMKAKATAQASYGTTAATRRTEVPPRLLKAVEKSRYRIRASQHTAGSAAAYPVLIDPLIFTETHVFASDAAAEDRFGGSVAMSGDTIVVGASFDDTAAGLNAGSAYVYVRSGTTWSEQAHLLASDVAADDFFGGSVAISGDTIVVGAPVDDTAAGMN